MKLTLNYLMILCTHYFCSSQQTSIKHPSHIKNNRLDRNHNYNKLDNIFPYKMKQIRRGIFILPKHVANINEEWFSEMVKYIVEKVNQKMQELENTDQNPTENITTRQQSLRRNQKKMMLDHTFSSHQIRKRIWLPKMNKSKNQDKSERVDSPGLWGKREFQDV